MDIQQYEDVLDTPDFQPVARNLYNFGVDLLSSIARRGGQEFFRWGSIQLRRLAGEGRDAFVRRIHTAVRKNVLSGKNTKRKLVMPSRIVDEQRADGRRMLSAANAVRNRPRRNPIGDVIRERLMDRCTVVTAHAAVVPGYLETSVRGAIGLAPLMSTGSVTQFLPASGQTADPVLITNEISTALNRNTNFTTIPSPTKGNEGGIANIWCLNPAPGWDPVHLMYRENFPAKCKLTATDGAGLFYGPGTQQAGVAPWSSKQLRVSDERGFSFGAKGQIPGAGTLASRPGAVYCDMDSVVLEKLKVKLLLYALVDRPIKYRVVVFRAKRSAFSLLEARQTSGSIDVDGRQTQHETFAVPRRCVGFNDKGTAANNNPHDYSDEGVSLEMSLQMMFRSWLMRNTKNPVNVSLQDGTPAFNAWKRQCSNVFDVTYDKTFEMAEQTSSSNVVQKKPVNITMNLRQPQHYRSFTSQYGAPHHPMTNPLQEKEVHGEAVIAGCDVASIPDPTYQHYLCVMCDDKFPYGSNVPQNHGSMDMSITRVYTAKERDMPGSEARNPTTNVQALSPGIGEYTQLAHMATMATNGAVFQDYGHIHHPVVHSAAWNAHVYGEGFTSTDMQT